MTTTTTTPIIITISQQGPPAWLIPAMVGVIIAAVLVMLAWKALQ